MESDFLRYYHSEGMKRAATEEEQLALHKKQMEMESKRHQLEDDDDFYNEEVPVQESTRVNVPTKKLPPKRPIAPPAPRQVPPRPATAPTPAPTPVNRVRTRATSQMDEALAMIDKITDKITGMFFKYGFDGLEKISRHLNEDIEEIVNPQPTYREDYNESYNANEERILELEEENNKLRRLLERQLERSKEEAAEKPVARKPVKPVIEETTIDESVDDVPEELEEVDESYGMPETDNEKLNEQFISMNQNMDINALGASLSQQAAIQKRSESAGDARLAQVAARAEMLQQSMNKKIDDKIASVEQQQAESFQQSEELEIVDVEEPTQPIENVKSTPAAESKKKVSKKKKSK